MLKYERGLNHSYVIFSGEDSCIDELTVSMLRENNIAGLLPTKITKNNGETEIAYEISMYQSMVKAFENRRIQNQQIMNCLMTLESLLEDLEGYYLDSSGLVLNPENIYWNGDLTKICFCYNPKKTDKAENLDELSQLILQRADFGDYKSVVYAYELYQAVKEENFSIRKLLERLEEVKQEQYFPLEQSAPIVADNIMTVSDYSANAELLENYQENAMPMNNVVENINSIDEKDMENSQSAESVMLNMSKLFEEDEDDWEKEEPSGKLFGLSKRKKNKKEKKKVETEVNDDFMEESFFLGGAESKSIEPDIFSNRCLVLNSLNQISGNFRIDNFPFLIGSLQYAVDGCIEDSSIGRFHARFDQNRGKVYLSDLNSASGTFLNNERLSGSSQKEIKIGDRIRFGNLDFSVTE